MKVFVKEFACLIIIASHVVYASQIKRPLQRQVIISTVSEALRTVRKVITDFPTDDNALQAYEKAQAVGLIKSAKVLYDNARVQILDVLQELETRKAYWQYQQEHQWRYFLTKNPLKWITGQSQNVEIENNLEQIQSYQGELYVLLGQLAELGNIYDHNNKTVFVADYTQGYKWIDELLDLLPRIKVAIPDGGERSSFIARAKLLQSKLERVGRFKNQILLDITETQIPAHLARNWLKYAAMMYVFGQAYSRADQIGNWATTSFESSKQYLTNVATPVKETFFPGSSGKNALIVKQENINEARSAMKVFLNTLEKKNIITAQEKNSVIKDEAAGSSAAFQTLLNTKIMSNSWNKLWYAAEGWSIFIQLLALHGGGNVESEIAGLRNLVLLAPAGIVGWIGYSGLRAVYQAVFAQNYAPLSRSLRDINSLFVDQTKPLDDERYGKMIYLLYSVKQRARKELPYAMQGDFLRDLDNIESKEFDVAAKRRIVEDMFKKYSFLKLTDKK